MQREIQLRNEESKRVFLEDKTVKKFNNKKGNEI